MKAALAPITCLQKQWYKEWLKQKEKQEIEEILETLDKSKKTSPLYAMLYIAKTMIVFYNSFKY